MTPGSDDAKRRLTWRMPLRQTLRFGFPILGIVVIARAMIASIGGDIQPGRFALGLLLMVMTLAARLVPGR